MATNLPLSRSIRKGQAAIVCQLCENESKLKWKCLECGLMMCQRCCDKVHPKFPSAKDHTIIDIKDISKYETEFKPTPNFTSLGCRVHKTAKCCMFCKSCNELVCPVCIAQTHKRHDFIELCEGYDITTTKIRKGKENMDSIIHSLTNSQAELHKIKYLEQASHKRTRQEILSYEQVLADAVKVHVKRLLNEVDKKWEDVARLIDKEEKKVNDICQNITKQKDQENDLLESNDAEKIFSTLDISAQSIQPTKPVNTIVDHVPEFIQGDKSIIPQLVGSLKSVSTLYNPVPEVIEEYTTDIGSCDNLIACPDGSFWINDFDLQRMQKVNPTGGFMTVISNFNIDIKDISLMSNGDVLLCVSDSSVLKVIALGTEEVKDSPYNITPLKAISVHVTHDNKVMVGSAPPNAMVIVMDQLGKQEQIFQYDKHNKPIFRRPTCIISNKLNVICAIDMMSRSKRKIVVLDQEGILTNVYTGHQKIYSDFDYFRPSNILSLPSDNFLIVEPNSYKPYLHILNSQGNFLTVYDLNKMEIDTADSVSFFGYLFIGGAEYDDGGQHAVVYKVNNFVW